MLTTTLLFRYHHLQRDDHGENGLLAEVCTKPNQHDPSKLEVVVYQHFLGCNATEEFSVAIDMFFMYQGKKGRTDVNFFGATDRKTDANCLPLDRY